VTLRRLLVLFALFVSSLAARPVAAQQVDVIRGRVIGVDSQAIDGVRVTVTSLSGAVNRQTRTDKNGRFTVTFPNGEGDYFVSFSAIGYAVKRFEVKRTADQDILVADARLSRTQEIDAMRITAPRDKVDRNSANADVSGTEKQVNTAALTADQLGDLAAMAASIPGITLVPGSDGDPSGFSALGLSADQNNTTLNGAQFGGANLPRDAAISSSLMTSPYDVSRGGFSGAQFSINTRGGSNYKILTNSLNIDAPQMQWTDPAGRALGQQYSNLSLGGLVGGPVKLDESFYNFAYQFGRRANDLQTLLNTDPLGLQTSGISADSVARLRTILSGLRVPMTVAGIPSERLGDNGLVLGTFNVAPSGSKSGTAVSITYQGSWNRSSPATTSLTSEFPAHSGERTNWSGFVSARHSTYFGFGILSETQLSVNQSRNWGTPYLAMPNGNVLVNSVFPDGTSGVKFVSFGGNPSLGVSSRTGSVGFSNLMSWFSENNKHRLKLNTELRRDDYTQDQTTNLLGSFSFNSLADLQGGRPALFTRQLTPRQRTGAQYVGAIALGDSYKYSSDLQVQYGVRLDGNQYEGTPTRNPALEQLFGVRNDLVPNKVYASPRVGFSWAYGTAPQIGGFEGAMRGPRAVVRGGIGLFQNTPGTTLVGNAIDNTGLPSAVQQVTCYGPAAPSPDWNGYQANPGSIPSACADGTQGTVFSNTAPNVTLFARDYAAQRALRSNLQWAGPILNNTFSAVFEATYSRNLNQPGSFDLNFSPVQRFALASEGSRPVYALPTSIDPSTGAIASRDARVSPLYNRVSEMRSDLTSESKQFQARFSPATFSTAWSWSLAYVYANYREQYRGFQSTAGNPIDVNWGRSGMDQHHQIQYSVGYNFFDAVRVNWNGSVRSGAPFTPMVAGDINGDGYANDRAFIFDPSKTADASVASAMQSLLANSAKNVRDCLTKQMGQIASRNSCEGPWTTTANLNISFNPLKLGLPQRAQVSFGVNNPLGAADLLLHGENHLQGWGQTPFADPQLLYVRGYDPVAQRFKYEVNQRFGATNPAFNQFRSPVVVTAMMRFDLGPTREQQSLVQQLNSGRRTQGNKINESVLRMIYGSGGGLVNPMSTMLRQADSLGLTTKQADSLATLNRWYMVRLDSIWSPVAKYLGALPDSYDERSAYAAYRKAREGSVDLLVRLAPGIKGMLAPEQRRKLPSIVASYIDPRYLSGIRSGTAGGAFNPFGGMGGGVPMGGAGGTTMVIVR
jgi:hypothetical protein